MKSVAEIIKEYKALSESEYEAFILEYGEDERAAVVKLCMQALKKHEALLNEKARMEKMYEFERQFPDCQYICGIDEVGRGPLAGPVVAGAVILPKDCDILYLNDSKQLSEKKREELYDIIMDKALAVATGLRDAERIDEINILEASSSCRVLKTSCAPTGFLIN